MAWIARDKDSFLFIYKDKPTRGDMYWKSKCNHEGDYILMSSGADEKLIGKHLTWEDEPVEI